MPTSFGFVQKFNYKYFGLYLCLELLNAQAVCSHYTPSLLHISTMMMNAMATLKPTVEYSTHLLSLLFSTPFLLLFFFTILLPPLAFVYVLYVSFSLAIFYNFSIAFFVVMLLQTPKFQKYTQLLTTNTNCF
jgi:hypothetical protein